ncbi:MAG TPA: ACP S-malonyltransferase [Candidatus Limnocylindria bacterium]|jgi:[acyl-carrier-protein] S-malonyltransferase|nr:ACP S-malonyltransferase [Candidatus Limnocylindria bacterium]
MSKTALLFSGQGAQKIGMGKAFAEASPVARQLFDEADRLLGVKLSEYCFSGPEVELTRTENAQPAIFLTSWVAFTLLRERLPGLEFQATAGLSLGEFTALAAAGAMSFEDGLRLVRARGRFMQEACDLTRGGMAAVIGLDESPTREVCEATGVTLANLNCPGQIVISGELDRIPAAVEAAKAKGAKKAIPLAVAGAYHSPLMESAQPKLAAELGRTALSSPRVPVVANVTAAPYASVTEIPATLVRQVTSSVRWEESMRYLLAQGFTRFIELGPDAALAGFMKRIDKTAKVVSISDPTSLEAAVAALGV